MCSVTKSRAVDFRSCSSCFRSFGRRLGSRRREGFLGFPQEVLTLWKRKCMDKGAVCASGRKRGKWTQFVRAKIGNCRLDLEFQNSFRAVLNEGWVPGLWREISQKGVEEVFLVDNPPTKRTADLFYFLAVSNPQPTTGRRRMYHNPQRILIPEVECKHM